MKSVIAMTTAVVISSLICGCGSGAQATTPVRHVSDTRTSPSSLDTEAHTVVAAGSPAPVATIQLVPSLAHYTQYVDNLLLQLQPQLESLRTALSAGDLSGAEQAWLTAHMTYLKIGQDDAAYGAFGDLGEEIDGLAAGLPDTVDNPKFTGFHRIEVDLWRHHDVSSAAADTAKLISFAKGLTRARVASDLPLQTLAIDGWALRAHEILEDGLRDSLSQEDDYGSNTDLASLSADVVATREMLRVLTPLLTTRAPEIVPTATEDLDSVDAAISAAGGAEARRNLHALPLRQRQALDQSTGAAVETLAPISEIIQVTVAGS